MDNRGRNEREKPHDSKEDSQIGGKKLLYILATKENPTDFFHSDISTPVCGCQRPAAKERSGDDCLNYLI